MARLAALLVALGCLWGCSGDARILIEVTRDPDTTPAAIEELRFFVGVRGGHEDSHRPFVDDAEQGDLVALDGRDLVDDPYRLLLRRGSSDELQLRVAVIGLAGGQIVGFGALDQPLEFSGGKVPMWQIVLRGGNERGVEITEHGCLQWIVGEETVTIASPADKDCDGDHVDVDCDDYDPEVGPSKPEICDGKDNNCDGRCDVAFDADGDGYSTCGSRIEYKDEDDKAVCHGISDEWVDCDDDDPQVHPEAEEVCDGRDNNCDGRCDAEFDADGDGYSTCGSLIEYDGDAALCVGRVSDDQIDCDDEDPEVHPGARQRCDGKDNNCDGVFYPEVQPCYARSADNTICLVGQRRCGDADGMGWLSECELAGVNEMIAPGELCEAYETCDQNPDVADPWACANQSVAATQYNCTAYYDEPDDLCDRAEAVLPNTTSEDRACRWSVIGGEDQAHYRVGLRSFQSGSTPDEINVCAAIFVLRDAHDEPPQSDSILVAQQVDGAPHQLIRLSIKAEPTNICPAAGLLCTNLGTPPEVGDE